MRRRGLFAAVVGLVAGPVAARARPAKALAGCGTIALGGGEYVMRPPGSLPRGTHPRLIAEMLNAIKESLHSLSTARQNMAPGRVFLGACLRPGILGAHANHLCVRCEPGFWHGCDKRQEEFRIGLQLRDDVRRDNGRIVHSFLHGLCGAPMVAEPGSILQRVGPAVQQAEAL